MADCHSALDLVEMGMLSFQLNHTICNSTAKISIILASHGNGFLFCVSLVGAFYFKQSITAFYIIFGHVANHTVWTGAKETKLCVQGNTPLLNMNFKSIWSFLLSVFLHSSCSSNAFPCFTDGTLSRAALSNKDSNSEADVLVERATLPKFDEVMTCLCNERHPHCLPAILSDSPMLVQHANWFATPFLHL